MFSQSFVDRLENEIFSQQAANVRINPDGQIRSIGFEPEPLFNESGFYSNDDGHCLEVNEQWSLKIHPNSIMPDADDDCFAGFYQVISNSLALGPGLFGQYWQRVENLNNPENPSTKSAFAIVWWDDNFTMLQLEAGQFDIQPRNQYGILKLSGYLDLFILLIPDVDKFYYHSLPFKLNDHEREVWDRLWNSRNGYEY